VQKFLVAAAVTILFAACAGAARADVATVPADGSTAFDGGTAVTSPLEQVAGAIASTIAGRVVSVRCEGDDDWATLARASRFEPAQILGYVSFVNGLPVDYAELSPDICRSLQTFAQAATKPTKCSPTPAPKTVREKVVTTVKGKRVVRWRTKTVQSIPLTAPVACFANGRQLSQDSTFWDDYFQTAEALQTLVHESIHLRGDPVESHAECYGMQYVALAAQQLGDTADDAVAIASYYATKLYPLRRTQSPDYWSADCRMNGPLDLTPNDNVWP
jgi:hypothetical protein